jgi:hypothetical protein
MVQTSQSAAIFVVSNGTTEKRIGFAEFVQNFDRIESRSARIVLRTSISVKSENVIPLGHKEFV